MATWGFVEGGFIGKALLLGSMSLNFYPSDPSDTEIPFST